MKGLVSVKLVLFTAGFFPVMFCCCSSEGTQQREKPPVTVKTETVEESNYINTLDYVGVVEEGMSVALSFPTIGTIESVYVSEGERVRKGQLLAILDSSSAQSLKDAAESTLKQAQDAYDRLLSIHNKGSLPDIQLVDVETKLQQAKSSYDIAVKNLGDCILYAPFSGVIGKKMAEPGEYAIVGKPVLTILDISSVKVNFSVPENEVSLINGNNKSVISVSALGDKKFYGDEIEKNVSSNPISHTYQSHVKLSNPLNELLPGMVCGVEVVLNESSSNIIVPISIVQTLADGKKFVWLMDNGLAKRCLVVTREIKGNGIVITSGLKVGDRIVTEGYQKINEGDKISGR